MSLWIQRNRCSRGFALIAVMWVVLLAGILLLGFNRTVRAQLGMAFNEVEAVRAHWLARAGVEQAIAVLSEDDIEHDGAWDAWYENSELFKEVPLQGGNFSVMASASPSDSTGDCRYGLIDHGGKLNVNFAEAESLKSLLHLEARQVSAILDWRDKDSNLQGDWAEAQYYCSLRFPYRIRNDLLQTVGELLLIRGIDEKVFYGEDANLNGILDPNEDDRQSCFPRDNGDGELQQGLGGLTTVYSSERNDDVGAGQRINLNKADKQTLVNKLGFSNALADAVVKKKAKGSGSGGESKRFNSLMELLDVTPGKDSGGGSVKKIEMKWLAEHWEELTLTDDKRLLGRVNVNTASRQVLSALPKMTDSSVEAIVRRQDTGDGPFQSVGELFTESILTEEQFKAVAEKITVRSNVFEIRCRGVTAWGISREIVAIVDRASNKVSILYWYQSE